MIYYFYRFRWSNILFDNNHKHQNPRPPSCRLLCHVTRTRWSRLCRNRELYRLTSSDVSQLNRIFFSGRNLRWYSWNTVGIGFDMLYIIMALFFKCSISFSGQITVAKKFVKAIIKSNYAFVVQAKDSCNTTATATVSVQTQNMVRQTEHNSR